MRLDTEHLLRRHLFLYFQALRSSHILAALDAMKWPEIAGCIAGDDTIMCAVRSVDETLIVMDKIKKIIAAGTPLHN